MSEMVESARKNAKPRTEPTVSHQRITAPRRETVSAARMVRQALSKPRTAELRRVRPLCTSSFRRSKNTTYESTVTPMETMMPATPDRVSASPFVLESQEMTLQSSMADTPSPATTTSAIRR